MTYPILEFDETKEAFIEPSKVKSVRVVDGIIFPEECQRGDKLPNGFIPG